MANLPPVALLLDHAAPVERDAERERTGVQEAEGEGDGVRRPHR